MVRMGELLRDARLRVGMLVCVCFTMAPMGYFAWFYNVVNLADASTVDFYTLVLAYFVQAAGVCAYMAARHALGKRAVLGTVYVSLVLFALSLEPAALSGNATVALVVGLVMNIPCGYLQGHYLTCVAELVPATWRGRVFAWGYAAATVASWLIASYGGNLTSGVPGLATCLLLALLAAVCLHAVSRLENPVELAPSLELPSLRSLVLLVGAAVVVASLVKNTGFRSLATEFAGGSIEMSRLFYGVGLIMAGLVADRDRRLALVCCAASLAVPFLQLALEGFEVSGFVLWSLDYFLQSFFIVWRVTVFADLADSSGRIWLAGAGLAFGRIGDAVGTWLTEALASSGVVLVALAFALFVLSFILLLLVSRRMYDTSAAGAVANDEFDPLVEFCDSHDLSRREQDVLYFLIDGRTNAETAKELGVTEATVKFHVSNILKKTGCASRNDVAKLYNKSLKER